LSATDYRALLVEWRSTQLKATAANVKRLQAAFDGAVKSLAAKVEAVGEETLAGAAATALLGDIAEVLANLKADYGQLLELASLEVAQVAADRESAVATLADWGVDANLLPGLTKTVTLSSGAEASVRFSTVAQSAVERAANRVYSDGWRLSDRLWSLDQQTREVVRQTIVQGVTEQISAREMAKRLETHLRDGMKLSSWVTDKERAVNVRYSASRIARTEINTAHREAHIQSAIDPSTGQLKGFISAIGWRLSVSHPRMDICDVWASDDGDNLGEGNYLPENVPSDHPHGLCYTISVLADYPEVSGPSKAANPDGVPESQAQYYADKLNDPTAARWLDKRGSSGSRASATTDEGE
jgi:hypothetical protein